MTPGLAPSVSRLAAAEFGVIHCRYPAWEAGEFTSLSAASSIGYSFTTQHCVLDRGGQALDRTVPAGAAVIVGGEPPSWLRVDRPSHLVEVTAAPALRAAIAEEMGVAGAGDLGDLSIDGDPVIRAPALRLAALARQGDPDRLCAEALVRRLYGHVLRSRFGGRLRERGDGALDARRLARVIEHIEAHPAAPLTLAALAEVAALTPHHFQRSFTRATGCSPHHMVSLMRALRARDLLAAGVPEPLAASRSGLTGRRGLRRALRRHGLAGGSD